LVGRALASGGGAGLIFISLGRGGIPPTPPFRRALASTTDRVVWGEVSSPVDTEVDRE